MIWHIMASTLIHAVHVSGLRFGHYGQKAVCKQLTPSKPKVCPRFDPKWEWHMFLRSPHPPEHNAMLTKSVGPTVWKLEKLGTVLAKSALGRGYRGWSLYY